MIKSLFSVSAMSFASEEHEQTYKYNLKEVTRMLKTKHGDSYMVRKKQIIFNRQSVK